MRISDWSSDVCSSDLIERRGRRVIEIDHRGDIAIGRVRPASAARNWSTSASVLSLPKLTRIAPSAISRAMPMPSNTWLGSPRPDAQAAPLDTAKPLRSSCLNKATSEENTYEHPPLMPTSSDVFVMKKKK